MHVYDQPVVHEDHEPPVHLDDQPAVVVDVKSCVHVADQPPVHVNDNFHQMKQSLFHQKRIYQNKRNNFNAQHVG